jgi:hypothetical protein
MPLTEQEFNKLKEAGYTDQQIIAFDAMDSGGNMPSDPMGGIDRMGISGITIPMGKGRITLKPKGSGRAIPQRQIELIQDTAEVALGMDKIVNDMEKNKFKTGMLSPRFYPGIKGDIPMQVVGKPEEASFKAAVDRYFQKYRKVTTGVQAGYPELQWLAADVPKTTDRPDILIDKAYSTKEINVENLRNMLNVLDDTGYDTSKLRLRYRNLLEKSIPDFADEKEAEKANLKKGTIIKIGGKRAIWE